MSPLSRYDDFTARFARDTEDAELLDLFVFLPGADVLA